MATVIASSRPGKRNFRVIFDRNFCRSQKLHRGCRRNAIRSVSRRPARNWAPTCTRGSGRDTCFDQLRHLDIVLEEKASASAWPKLPLLGKRRVRKLLQSYVRSGKRDPERGLGPTPAVMKASAEAVGWRVRWGPTAPGWCGVEAEHPLRSRPILPHEAAATQIRHLCGLGQARRLTRQVGGAKRWRLT